MTTRPRAASSPAPRSLACSGRSIAPRTHSPTIDAHSVHSPHPQPGITMAINTSKVLVGGLAAGVVANIVGFVAFGLLLGPRMEAEAVAVAPVLAGRGMSGSSLAINVIAQFVVGILLVWLYAAIRPR